MYREWLNLCLSYERRLCERGSSGSSSLQRRDVWPGLKTASAPSVSRGEIPGPNRTLVHYAYHTQSSSVIKPMYPHEPLGSSSVCPPPRAVLMNHYKNITHVHLDNAGFLLLKPPFCLSLSLFLSYTLSVSLSLSICLCVFPPSVLYIDAPNADGHWR